MCFKSVQRIHTHAHTCIFDLLRKKSPRATVSPMNPCVVRVESGAKKIVNFRHFFSFTFSPRVSSACHSHAAHNIHTAHTRLADRPGTGVIKEKSNVFDTAAAESRCR